MDEIALLRALAAGGKGASAAARADALRALEARLDRASTAPWARPVRRLRRGVFALAGSAAAIAAIVVGILAIGSGPSAEPALAAKVLRQTATVAEGSDGPALAPPGPGQFLYVKTKVVQLQGWLPEGHAKGTKAEPRYFVPINDPVARYALVPALKEVWTARDGATREREILGRVGFLSEEDQRQWVDEGSPPPWSFDPAEHDVRRDSSGRLTKEFRSQSWRGSREFTYAAKLAKLPTEPEALRLALENRPLPGYPKTVHIGASPADSERGRFTIEKLMNVLSEPITSPALRAAAFNALAEIPGIELERGVTDVAGRRGDAIWFAERGFGRQFIFDPRTSEILAQAEVIFDAEAAGYPQLADDTVFREIAYLRSGVVDSIDARP